MVKSPLVRRACLCPMVSEYHSDYSVLSNVIICYVALPDPPQIIYLQFESTSIASLKWKPSFAGEDNITITYRLDISPPPTSGPCSNGTCFTNNSTMVVTGLQYDCCPSTKCTTDNNQNNKCIEYTFSISASNCVGTSISTNISTQG